MRFKGISKVSVDAKGRFALPKNHRDNLEKNGTAALVVTADPTGCIVIYPEPIWKELEERVMALPNSNPQIRMVQRLYVGHATEVELDGTGRLLLSQELRDHADMGRKAVLIGQGKKFELWDERTWEIESGKWKQQVSDMNPADMPEALQNISF